jgi:hypothetical protein
MRLRGSIAIGGILLLLGAAATAPATTTTRFATHVTVVAPRLAQPGETVRVAGTVIGGGSIVGDAFLRVSAGHRSTRARRRGTRWPGRQLAV